MALKTVGPFIVRTCTEYSIWNGDTRLNIGFRVEDHSEDGYPAPVDREIMESELAVLMGRAVDLGFKADELHIRTRERVEALYLNDWSREA